MIEAFSLATAHLYQDALASQARLRYRVFVRQRGLPHSFYDDLEYDEFDTPSAVYLVWRDRARVVRGLIRLLRTDRPYMLKAHWPELIVGRDLPASPLVWEMTRVCIDKSVAPPIRRTILPELLGAVEEFLAANGAEGVIGVTRMHLLLHFIREGVEWLGQPALIEGETERAFFVPAGCVRPHFHCAKYQISDLVLASPNPVAIPRRNAA